MEERIHNGVTYRRSGPGEPWQRVGAPAPQGGTYIPPSARTERKKGAEADKAVIDVQTGAATLPYAGPTAAANLANTNVDTAVTAEKLNDALIARERGLVEEATRTKALDAFNAAPALDKLASDIEEAYKSGVGKTGGFSGILDYLPTGENREFGLIGGRARGTFKQALGFTGGEGNTAGELTINYGPYIPDQYDTNEEVERKLSNIRELAKEARKKSISYLGGIPDAAGRVVPLPRDLTPDQIERIYSGASLPTASGVQAAERLAAGAGVTSRGGFVPVPSLQGIDQQVIDMVGQGRSSDEIMEFLNQAYAGTEPEHGGRLRASPELGGFVSGLVERHRRDPSKPVRSLGSKWEMLGGYEQGEQGPQTILGIDPDSTLGAGAISAGNAVTFGNLGNLTGRDDVLSASRNERPGSSFVGDVLGSSIAMGGLTGLGAKAGIGALTRGGGIGADVLYGGARGTSEGKGDLRYGLLGAGAAGLGNVAGRYALAPAVRAVGDTAIGQGVASALANTGTAARNAYRGVRGEATLPYQGANIPRPLSTGEQVVTRNLPDDVDPIIAALTQGREAGMPMVLADVSPQLRNIGGAAYRRADLDTQAQIERALTERNRGQLGRLESQVETNFGPLRNPNRIREDLTERARTAAAPLYDEAYAQPAITSPELESLLGTPFGRQAIGRARNIAANERRDPMAMGFALDESGAPVLNPVPINQMDSLQAAREGWDAASANLQASIARRDSALDPSKFTAEVRAAEQGLTDAVRALDEAKAAMAVAPSSGQVTPTRGFTTQTLDYAKRGMDDVLEQYRNPITNKLVLDEAGRAENAVLRQFLGEVDTLNPVYGQARSAYAGPASIRTAMGQGQDIYNIAPRDIADILARQNTGEQEAFRLGGRVGLMDRARIASDTNNPWERTYGGMENRQRLATTFGEDATAPFNRAFETERAMEQTRNAFLGGSPTQARQALDEQLGGQVGQGVTNAVIDTALTGAPVRAGLGLAQRLLGDRAQLGFAGAREEASSDIARLLAQERPIDEIAQLLSEAASRRSYVDNLRSRLGGVGAATATGGASIGY